MDNRVFGNLGSQNLSAEKAHETAGGVSDKYYAIDLFNNPVGYFTSLAKCSAFCCF
jgi:hypothetical protein